MRHDYFDVWMITYSAFLTEMLVSNQNSHWIGMKMLDVSKEFAWVDNTPVTYVNWAKEEPNGGDSVSKDNEIRRSNSKTDIS